MDELKPISEEKYLLQKMQELGQICKKDTEHGGNCLKGKDNILKPCMNKKPYK